MNTRAIFQSYHLIPGVLPQPKVSSLTDTGETVYEDPDRQRSDNNYEDPEKMDIYRTMSNVPLIERGHRTLLDTNVTVYTKKYHCFQSYINSSTIAGTL